MITIKVLIADDHFVVRQGILALLSEVDGIEVVGEAEDGEEAVVRTLELAPDVVLMDLAMPRRDGVTATRVILAERPETAILVITGTKIESRILEAVRAGAVGYLSKEARRADFARAIRDVHRGELHLPTAITRRLLGHAVPHVHIPVEHLTSRETDILRLVARGYSNQRIADTIYVAEATVRGHVSRLLAKLGLSNRVEAALWALRQGVATLHDET